MAPVITILAILAVVSFNFTAAENYDECRITLAKVMKRQLETFSVCMNEMQFTSRKDRSNKLHCIFKCLAIREGLLSEEGLVSRETIRIFIDREVPEPIRPRAVDIMETCIDIGYGKVDPKEEYCKSYAPIIKCAIDGINKFCDDLKPDVVKSK